MQRKLIEVDKALCSGCGDCLKTCQESALQIIDGKAHLVNDMICVGFGCCIPTCPTGALQLFEREETPDHQQLIMLKNDSLIWM